MRRRRKFLIAAGVVLGLPVILLAVLVTYLLVGDLGRHRATVERLLSDALGRELAIHGEFHPRIGLTSSIVASGVDLANPPWAAEPSMVHVDRLAIEADLLSLVFGPLHLRRIEIAGARVELESDREGSGNWEFDAGTPDRDQRSAPLEIEIDRIVIDGARLTYRDSPLGAPVVLHVARFEGLSSGTGMLDIRLDGDVDDEGLEISGRLGVLSELLRGGAVAADLEGRIGDAKLSVRGQVGELSTLTGADLEATLDAPNPQRLLERLGLPAPQTGPFRAAATLTPEEGGASALTLVVDAAVVSADVKGSVDAILEPRALDLSCDASGPDLAALGAWLGYERLPAEPFRAVGRVRWNGFPLRLDEVVLRVGEDTIHADGVLGAPPRFLDSDFRIEAGGPDVAWLAELAGAKLASDPYRFRGRLARIADGVLIDRIEARIGRAVAELDGVLGDPPAYEQTDLRLRVQGPDLSRFGSLAGRELPVASFGVAGHLAYADGAIALGDVRVDLAEHTLRVDGHLRPRHRFVGSDLRLRLQGPDAAHLAGLAGETRVPAEPYRVEGRIGVLRDGYEVSELVVNLGDLAGRVDGRLGRGPGLAGTELRLRAAGQDLSRWGGLAGRHELPAEPFRLQGRVAIDERFHLEAFEGQLGDAVLQATGTIGRPPDLGGTALQLELRAPSAATIGSWFGRSGLPAEPLRLSGSVRVDGETYGLDHVTVGIGDHRLAADGALEAGGRSLVGTELTLELAGPDLRALGGMVGEAGLVELPSLPELDYSLTGRVRVDEDAYELEAVAVTLGTAHARLDGRVGGTPGLVGTDLAIDADGPDASLLAPLTRVDVPVAPFSVSGRVERDASGFRFHAVSLRLGDYHASIDGALGEPPRLIGTRLDVAAAGPDLRPVERLADLPSLPEGAFEVTAHLEGTPQEFKVEGLNARLGASDVRGSARVGLRGRPTVSGGFESDRLDLAVLVGGRETTPVEQAEPAEAPKPPRGDERRFLFRDEAFDLHALQLADGDLSWSVGELLLPATRFDELRIGLALHDGALRVEPFEAQGASGGRLAGRLSVEPVGALHRVALHLTVDDARLDLSSIGGDPTQWPPLDLELDLTGVGESPRALAAGANGRAQLVVGAGNFDNALLDRVATDVLIEILDVLNPLAQRSRVTRLECAVGVIQVTDGAATLEPFAVQTSKTTVLGQGAVDLKTEELDFRWVAKQRKGVGLSVSSITNPYIKLGGTLAGPALEIKPLEAIGSTGVAVATAGLSILGKGLWDRITSEKKVCAQALQKAERQSSDRNE